MTTSEQPHSHDDPDENLHDMGGDIGPTPSGSRGGGGSGPAEVREADELNDRLDREDAAGA